MTLQRVTITGADDSTDIAKIVELSREFPFVEWGILVSKRAEGTTRFPTRSWIDRFASDLPENAKVSTHICGAWVRELLNATLDWGELPKVLKISQRLQINTHAQPHVENLGFTNTLRPRFCVMRNSWYWDEEPEKEFIFQIDGRNDDLAIHAFESGLKVSALFDKSGGAGVLPTTWPAPFEKFWCGYAGGLGPNNVVEQVEKIQYVCERPFWIDMEQRVRNDHDQLDLSAVRSVLEKMSVFIAATKEA